ncbi:hypothetical protein LTR37_015465 [Vermiconidia calcicola]|uniref:Uncharacterized protein n=1 Tax=Vermiconidia calcicola TaxID=1690605 RepID=A0ACC3MRI6_9PEZI|nr:hypothetical protein LTR37_015465 [Vermiconidia calcicola]
MESAGQRTVIGVPNLNAVGLTANDCHKDVFEACAAPAEEDDDGDHSLPVIIWWGGGFGFGFGIRFRWPKTPGCPWLKKILDLCETDPGGCWGSDCPPDKGTRLHDEVGKLCDDDLEECEPPNFPRSTSTLTGDCETTYSATDKIYYCSIGNPPLLGTDCTKTRSHTRTRCTPVQASKTTIWDKSRTGQESSTGKKSLTGDKSSTREKSSSGKTSSKGEKSITDDKLSTGDRSPTGSRSLAVLPGKCKTTQRATDYTYICTVTDRTVSIGDLSTIKPFTTCTKTVSSVISGCSVTAITTSIIEDEPTSCPLANITVTPLESDDSCPYSPIVVSPMDDQGQDGPEETCPYPESDAPSPDESQGEDGSPPDNVCPWLQNGDTTVSPNDEQGEDGNPNATCEWTRSVTVMAGGLAPAPWPTGHASELNVSCAGFDVHTGILSIDIRSLLNAAESGLSAAKTLNANSPGVNSALCAAASFKSRASRLDGCEHIMDELSMVGWGQDELANLTSIKSKMENLEDRLTSAYSTKFCAPGCIALGGFLTNIMDEYNDLLKEATKALKLASAAFIDGNSAEMTSAMCALTNIGRITSRLSLCPDVNKLLSETGLQGGFNPAPALAEAKSSRSSIMSRWKGLISCPTPTITNWNSLGEGMDWWLPIPFPKKKKKSCQPPTISSLPPCTRVWTTKTIGIPTDYSEPKVFPTRKRQEEEATDPLETVIESCFCEAFPLQATETDVFPTLSGRNCGTTRFCPNEVTVKGITVDIPTMSASEGFSLDISTTSDLSTTSASEDITMDTPPLSVRLPYCWDDTTTACITAPATLSESLSSCFVEPPDGQLQCTAIVRNKLFETFMETRCLCGRVADSVEWDDAPHFEQGFCPNGHRCIQQAAVTTSSYTQDCSEWRSDMGACTHVGATTVKRPLGFGWGIFTVKTDFCHCEQVDGVHWPTQLMLGNACPNGVTCPNQEALITTDEDGDYTTVHHGFNPCFYPFREFPEECIYTPTPTSITFAPSVYSILSVDSVRYSSGWEPETEIQARHQKASIPDVTRPAPGSIPQSPPMETVGPVPSVPKSRAVFADEEGNAYEVIDVSRTAEYRPYPSLYRSRRSQTLQRSRPSDDHSRRKSHFPPGPPRWLKDSDGVVKSTIPRTVGEFRKYVMVLEVRQMLGRVAELQNGTIYGDENIGGWWNWFGM